MIKGKKTILCAIASVLFANSAITMIPANAMNIENVESKSSTIKMEVISSSNLNIRKGPGTNYSKIGSAKKGTILEVVSISNGWAEVIFNGQTGYASAQYLKNVSSAIEMIAKVDDLNVRTGAGTSYAIIGKLNKGDKITVIETLSSGWVKVDFNDKIGYVSNVKGAYLEVVSDSTPSNPGTPSTPDNSIVKYSATADINLRKTASWSGEIITVIKKGTVVEAVSIGDNWIKVNYNSNTGYLPASHMKKVDSSTPSNPDTPNTTPNTKKQMIVKVDDLNVRKGAGTSYTKIGSLNKGDIVTIVEELPNGWVKIEYNNGYGYVSNVKGAYLEEFKSLNDIAIAEDLVQRIAALGSVVVDYSHEAEIKAIREAYDKLTAPLQLLVINIDEFEVIESKLANVIGHITYVNSLIEVLPDTIEYSHKNQIEYAKAKYDELGTENQAGVKIENTTKLRDAVAEIERLEQLKQEILQTNTEVQALIAEIEQLPALASITIDDKDQVMETVARFRMLPADVQFAVDTTPLEEAFDKVETLMAEEVVALIDALPSIDDLDLTHATLLTEARAKYNEITSRNNSKVTNINILTELEVKMLELTNSNPTIIELVNKIKDLDDVITFDNFDDTVLKVNEIEALIGTIDINDLYLVTNLEKYEEVCYQLETLGRVYHITTGAEVVELINNLPEVADIQWSHEELIVDARNAYIKISESEKLLVNNLDKLEKAEAEYNRIENGINEVVSAIHRIPALEDLTLDHKDLVEEARNLYDSYDEKITDYVNHINVGDLLNAEIKIEKLENSKLTQM